MSRVDDRTGPAPSIAAGRRPPACWFGIVAGGPALVGVEGRDPQVVGGEAGAPADARVGVGQQRRGRPGHAACRRRARRGGCASERLTIFQRRLRDGSTTRRASCSVSSRVATGAEGVGPRVVGRRAAPALGVDLVDRVVGPVDLDVEAHVEQVLVERRRQLGRDHRWRSRGLLAGGHGHGRQDAGQLHLELDRAVEVEVPEEAVLVVADGGDGAHHQPPRAAHLGAARARVDVLPEDPVVLLVHADGVRARCRACPARWLKTASK